MEETNMPDDDKTKTVLGYRLYDILNCLALEMEEQNTQEAEILIKAFNTHTHKNNLLRVVLTEMEEEG